jgi:hypothetical protein
MSDRRAYQLGKKYCSYDERFYTEWTTDQGGHFCCIDCGQNLRSSSHNFGRKNTKDSRPRR